MFIKLLEKIFGTKSKRDVRKMLPLVAKINALEIEYQSLSEDELKNKTNEFKTRLANGETTDDILCEAFAVVKNACRRLCGTVVNVCDHEIEWNMIPFDVQIMGGIALHKGKIAEMATGEGKTLVATMPLYLNALTGKNCQLVTVNDYLARRDSEWMGALYKYLGLTVGCLQNMQHPAERKEQYACDITYGTNSEFGFDYLRDMGMATKKEHIVQRDHYFAIVDEIDSILIDEARTPLIISGPVATSTHQFAEIQGLVANVYSKQNTLCSNMMQQVNKLLYNEEGMTDDELKFVLRKLLQVKFGMPTHKQLLRAMEDGELLKELEKYEAYVRSDNNRGMLQEVQGELYFTIDEKTHEADLTEKGRQAIAPDSPESFIMPDLLMEIHKIETDSTLNEKEKIEKRQAFQEAFAAQTERLHDLSQLLKAYCLFEKDVHYVVQNGKVLIVDEHTGRLMPGRRFSDGLHQALEAKENVKIEQETQTMATITIQNYFRMYEKLAGMTGTAETEASEFYQIYKLDVMVIPTNRPCIRKDDNDSIFKTKREKFNAVVAEVEKRYKVGQPVLVGTISVEDSEILSRMLKRQGIPHNVLNAKNNMTEADIVAQAGQKYAVTVATNMAGRGTDIKLGEGVAELGGLHVIASSRHDARRIDRQLRGRCSRQGDPGSSKFYVSLEDPLMRLFGSDRIVKIFEKFGLEEGEEIQHPLLNRSIETAQKRVEQQHFAVRKHTLEFDDVMNKQREIIYQLRKDALLSDNPHDVLFSIVENVVSENVIACATPKEGDKENKYDVKRLLEFLGMTFPIEFTEAEISACLERNQLNDPDKLTLAIVDKIEAAYNMKNEIMSPENMDYFERHVILESIDALWQEHLYAMDGLRSSMNLRSYAQKDPLVEYKNEAFGVFKKMMDQVYNTVVSNIFKVTIASLEEFERFMAMQQRSMATSKTNEAESLVNLLQQELNQRSTPVPEEPPQVEEVQIPYRRETEKVGRNDLCPCGSGKKYKKCCGK